MSNLKRRPNRESRGRAWFIILLILLACAFWVKRIVQHGQREYNGHGKPTASAPAVIEESPKRPFKEGEWVRHKLTGETGVVTEVNYFNEVHVAFKKSNPLSAFFSPSAEAVKEAMLEKVVNK